MGIMKNIVSLIFILVSLTAFCQPDDAVTKMIDGKKYYVHSVVEGNTLYGIHTLYNTELSKIIDSNPGLTNDLIIGQQILIPIDLDIANDYTIHVVAEGETLYGISKKYKLNVNDLKSLNPGIEEGIKVGQQIKVPTNTMVGETIQNDPVQENSYDISLSDSLVMHKVLEHETLYSIAKRYMVSTDTIRALNQLRGNKVKKGNVLKIPIKKVNYEILEKEIVPIHKDSIFQTDIGLKKGTYRIALLLPFMFAKNDIEMNKTIKFSQVREMYPTTKIALEFYQGFKMAADSLIMAGMNLEIFVFDTKKDTATIGKLIRSEKFDDIDLVIGPLYKKMIVHAVNECVKRDLRIVLPFKSDPSVLHENPYVFKTVTSKMTQIDGSVDYILKNHAHQNVIILKPYSDGDKALYERAKSRFNEGISNISSYNQQIMELSLGSSGGRDLNSFVKKDTTNIVIVPSSDVKFVTSALNRLNKVMNLNPYAKKLRIVVFGFEDWNKYEDIDVLHRNRLHQHYSSYRFVNYNIGKGLDFVKAHRWHTGSDPTVYSSQGFDVGMYFLSALYIYGTSFENSVSLHSMRLVQNDFRFNSIAAGSGYENNCVTIVRYHNFELIECVNP
jgi:LysM repeat protein